MIDYRTLSSAMLHVAGVRTPDQGSRLERTLAATLELYRDRGEFDGSLASAVECLTRAEYELHPTLVRAARIGDLS